MTVIITMAGESRRFYNEGFKIPKFKVMANGKTLFEWSLGSLEDFKSQHFIFACRSDHDRQWIREQAAQLEIHSVSVVPRFDLSLGQAHTAYDVLGEADNHEALWIYNIDTYIKHGLRSTDMAGYQGCLHVFESNNPSMSYVRYDENGHVVEVAEKKVISNWASVGSYGFENANLFRQVYEMVYEDCIGNEVQGERYVAPMFQFLLKNGKSIAAPRLDLSAVHILGTPIEVREFDHNAIPPYGAVKN